MECCILSSRERLYEASLAREQRFFTAAHVMLT